MRKYPQKAKKRSKVLVFKIQSNHNMLCSKIKKTQYFVVFPVDKAGGA